MQTHGLASELTSIPKVVFCIIMLVTSVYGGQQFHEKCEGSGLVPELN